MISSSVLSTIFAGGKLALATSQYLDSINSKWRTDEINLKLDAIRDVHLKAGYEFLKDAALSSCESNSINSLNGSADFSGGRRGCQEYSVIFAK